MSDAPPRDPRFFDDAYRGVAPWEIGRPQREILRLADEGRIVGSVLDVGCGTGENALELARRGHTVVGIDGAPLAIEKAQAKARDQNVPATFLVANALELPALDRTFETVVDSGLFHVFTDAERRVYAAGVHDVLRPRGHFHVLCWSERQPAGQGPRRVTRAEICAAFSEGWHVVDIRPAMYETNIHAEGGAHAWCATLRRA